MDLCKLFITTTVTSWIQLLKDDIEIMKNSISTVLMAIILLLNLSSNAQTEKTLKPKLENIAWISGNWKGEAFGGQVEENWSKLICLHQPHNAT